MRLLAYIVFLVAAIVLMAPIHAAPRDDAHALAVVAAASETTQLGVRVNDVLMLFATSQ